MIGGEPEALIRNNEVSGKAASVFQGDYVGGYTVSSIAPTEVILESPSGDLVPLPLKLRLSSASPAARSLTKPARKPAATAAKSGRGATKSRAETTSSVRDRLRELRRKRREQANKGRR